MRIYWNSKHVGTPPIIVAVLPVYPVWQGMFEEEQIWSDEPLGHSESSLHDSLFGSLEQSERAVGRKKHKRRHPETGPDLQESEEREREGGKRRRRKDAAPHASGEVTTRNERHKKQQKALTEHTTRKNRRTNRRSESKGTRKTQVSTDTPSAAADSGHTFLVSDDGAHTTLLQSQDANCRSSVAKPHQKASHVSSKLHSKMASKLEGSRFRMINEQMYTSTGSEAKGMFDSNPELFAVYHKGFATQVSKWETNPLDHITAYVKTLPKGSIIADFGCGEARLAQTVPQTVYSFDLVAANDHVTACDMAHTPLSTGAVDVCIFCLSLMGTNISDFILEARRVLKDDGAMRICEVISRFSSVDSFVKDVEVFGFKLQKKRTLSKMFLDLTFRAISPTRGHNLPQIALKPCIYKRR